MATSTTLWRDPALPPTLSPGAWSARWLPIPPHPVTLPRVGPQRLATLCPLPGAPYLLPAPPLVQCRLQPAQLQAACRAPPASA